MMNDQIKVLLAVTGRSLLDESIQLWREGCLSDVEMLTTIMPMLPSSPVSDALIEIVCKMMDDEKVEWAEREARDAAEREELASLLHDGVISEEKTLIQSDWDIEPFNDEDDDA